MLFIQQSSPFSYACNWNNVNWVNWKFFYLEPSLFFMFIRPLYCKNSLHKRNILFITLCYTQSKFIQLPNKLYKQKYNSADSLCPLFGQNYYVMENCCCSFRILVSICDYYFSSSNFSIIYTFSCICSFGVPNNVMAFTIKWNQNMLRKIYL